MKYRKVGNALDPAFRNDLNVNFKDIDDDIKRLQGIATENKNELLDEIERVEQESIERDNFLAGTNVDEFIQSINDTKDLALQAASNANVKAQLADDKANYAEQMGDYAKEQGDYAKAKGEYADEKAQLADEKATLAQQEIDTLVQLKIEVTDAKQQALQATESANTQADYAKEQGDYAKEQGDYTKEQADIVKDIIDQGGTVASVNGKTGTVVLDANDVGAIPEAEKGQANGVARLNEEGKVVDAHGNEVEGKVKSVNGKTGDIVLTSNDIGAVSQDDFEELETNVNNNATNVANLQNDLSTHLADYVKHPAFAIATGVNNYSVSIDPAPSNYIDGIGIVVAIPNNATGNCTLNVNGLGAKPIKKANGNNVTNLKANGIYTLRYNSNSDSFILQGEGGEYGTALAEHVLEGYTIGTENGIVTGTMPNRGTFNLPLGASVPAGYYSGGSVPNGKRFNVRTAFASTDSPLTVTGLGFTPSMVLFVGEPTWILVGRLSTRAYQLGNSTTTDASITSDGYTFSGDSFYRNYTITAIE